LRKLDELNNTYANYEYIGYFRIINGIVGLASYVDALIVCLERDQVSELEMSLQEIVLQIAINWLGICYATGYATDESKDKSVVEEKIANSIKEKGGTIILRFWKKITKILEQLNHYLTKKDSRTELQTQIVKSDDGSFTIIASSLNQQVKLLLPPASVLLEASSDQQQTLPTN
jgi:hypothetical protein